MKKFIFLFLLISILVSSCAAEPSPTVEPSAEASATGAVESTPSVESTRAVQSALGVNLSALKGVEVSVWHPWYGVESSLFDTLVKEFNEKNEWGIKVRAEGKSNFSNLYESVTVSLPTLEKPDMVIALPEQALDWDEDGVVAELSLYINDPAFGLDTSDIPQVFLAQDQINGRQIALPAQRDARLLLWNETWAQELGFDASPEKPEDFEQQACRAQQSKLKDAFPQNDYMGGWLVDTDSLTAYAWMLAFDGGVLESGDYRFLTPQNIETFTFLRQLSEKTCAWQANNKNPAQAFGSREALMVTISMEDLPDVARAFAAAGSKDKWSAVTLPHTGDSSLAVYGSSYVVLNTSETEKLAAWLFIRWLLENEQDARMVEASHLFPIRTSTLDLLGDYKKTHPQWAQAVGLIPQGKIQPQLSTWREVRVMLGDGFSHMYRVSVPSGQVPAILAQMEALSRDLTQ